MLRSSIVIAQRHAGLELVRCGIVHRAEGRINVGLELVVEELRCRVAAARRIVQRGADALAKIGTEADTDLHDRCAIRIRPIASSAGRHCWRPDGFRR